MLAEAAFLAKTQERAAQGQGGYVDATEVFKRLKGAANPPVAKPKISGAQLYTRSSGERGISIRKRGKMYLAEFDSDLSAASLRAAFERFLKQRKG